MTERGQGILHLWRRVEHLDKEREGRKMEEDQEYFKRYEKTKKEVIKKQLKGKEALKVSGDYERRMQCKILFKFFFFF